MFFFSRYAWPRSKWLWALLEHADKVAAIVDVLRRVVGRDPDADVIVYDNDIVGEVAPGLKHAAAKRKRKDRNEDHGENQQKKETLSVSEYLS